MSNSVPVLIYHHINPHSGDTVTVTPEIFSAQMAYLNDSGFNCLSVAGLLEHISGRGAAGLKPVLITFDDGWLDNFLYALPVLEKYRFKASVFLITDRVDAVCNDMLSASVPDHAESKRLIAEGEAGQVVMGWDLLRHLQSRAVFEFFSHTATHNRCTTLDDASLLDELRRSRARIEAELGVACPYLCWPYGDHDDRTISVAKACGYEALFTTLDGFVEPGSDPLSICRIEVKNSVEWLQHRLSEVN